MHYAKENICEEESRYLLDLAAVTCLLNANLLLI